MIRKQILLCIITIVFFFVVMFSSKYLLQVLKVLELNKYVSIMAVMAVVGTMIGIVCFFTKITGLTDDDQEKRADVRENKNKTTTSRNSTIITFLIIIAILSLILFNDYIFIDVLKFKFDRIIFKTLIIVEFFAIGYVILRLTGGMLSEKQVKEFIEQEKSRMEMVRRGKVRNSIFVLMIIFILALIFFVIIHFPSASTYILRFFPVN